MLAQRRGGAEKNNLCVPAPLREISCSLYKNLAGKVLFNSFGNLIQNSFHGHGRQEGLAQRFIFQWIHNLLDHLGRNAVMGVCQSGVGRNFPATTESIVWLAGFAGVGSELPIFTPRDLSLSAKEDI